MQLSDRYLQLLRQAINTRFGKAVNSHPDCVRLAKQLNSVGDQTLRRLFGLVIYKGGYSKYTLDALAQYCGYLGFTDFEQRQVTAELDLFFQSNANQGKNSWEKSEALCKRVSKSPVLLTEIHHQLMKYPLARTFFMEFHPMRDLSCTVYAQYFNEYLKYSHSNENKIFAYGFLFMGAFLSENEEFMGIYYREMKRVRWVPEVFVVAAGRKFGVPLLYSWLKKDEKSFAKAYQEMLKAKEFYRPASEKSVCSFEYGVLEHLIFTDKTEEMRFLIEHNTFQSHPDREFVPENRKACHDEVWKILCAAAYFKMGEIAICREYADQVDLKKLSVGWEKYYSILYYFVRWKLAEVQEQPKLRGILSNLIDETYFTYYRRFL